MIADSNDSNRWRLVVSRKGIKVTIILAHHTHLIGLAVCPERTSSSSASKTHYATHEHGFPSNSELEMEDHILLHAVSCGCPTVIPRNKQNNNNEVALPIRFCLAAATPSAFECVCQRCVSCRLEIDNVVVSTLMPVFDRIGSGARRWGGIDCCQDNGRVENENHGRESGYFQ
jgi:hypothetical protein